MYHQGKGVPQDYTGAEYWYRKAAEQGNAMGQLGLGTMYKIGKGVPQRWRELIEPLPPDDAARMPLGYYELAFAILDVAPAPDLMELRRRLDAARQIRHTGWGPFVSLHREPFEPHPVEGLIETWLGAPEEGRRLRTPAHCDFWRAHPDGRLFLQRGYDEDESEGVQAGTCIDVTLPIWRVGESMLHIAHLARSFEENPTIVVRCRYTALQNRVLTSVDHRRVSGAAL